MRLWNLESGAWITWDLVAARAGMAAAHASLSTPSSCVPLPAMYRQPRNDGTIRKPGRTTTWCECCAWRGVAWVSGRVWACVHPCWRAAHLSSFAKEASRRRPPRWMPWSCRALSESESECRAAVVDVSVRDEVVFPAPCTLVSALTGVGHQVPDRRTQSGLQVSSLHSSHSTQASTQGMSLKPERILETRGKVCYSL